MARGFSDAGHAPAHATAVRVLPRNHPGVPGRSGRGRALLLGRHEARDVERQVAVAREVRRQVRALARRVRQQAERLHVRDERARIRAQLRISVGLVRPARPGIDAQGTRRAAAGQIGTVGAAAFTIAAAASTLAPVIARRTRVNSELRRIPERLPGATPTARGLSCSSSRETTRAIREESSFSAAAGAHRRRDRQRPPRAVARMVVLPRARPGHPRASP